MRYRSYDPISQTLDITGPDIVEIKIQDDSTVIWINTEDGCVLRVCRIGLLVITDERVKESA